MQKRIEYCVPKAVKAAPAGSEWIHEIKMDGYRGLLERDGNTVRLRSRAGLDWTWRYPLIVEAALKLRTKQFVLDGEIVILTETGDADFDALHGNRRNSEAQLYAFDLLVLADDDLRELPLYERKERLGRLLTDPNAAIFPAPFQPGELGPGLYEAACKAGLEGIVSKHRETRYRPRTCDWRKIKNRAHPAFSREF